MADASEFVLRLGGQPYTGWEEISVTRDLTRMSGEFSLRLSRVTSDGLAPQVEPGRAAAVEIDGLPILKGWIDVKAVAYDKQSVSLTVTGRDRVADLIDCAATVSGPYEYRNLPLDRVIAAICQRYNISVHNQAGALPNVARLAIQPGETAFDFIERACRSAGILPVSDGIGGLVLVKPASARSEGALVFGGNILSGDVSVDATERHSLYVVKGQAEAVDADQADAAPMAGAVGRVTDTEVTRYRPKVLVGENQGYSGSLTDRALWERKADRARGMRASYTVQGWYAAAGALWRPNTIVKVTDPIAAIERDMLITSVNYTRGSQGTFTRLELALPEAFDIDTKQGASTGSSGSGSGSGSNTIWVDDND
jgi:prophage tail gpP-like protein